MTLRLCLPTTDEHGLELFTDDPALVLHIAEHVIELLTDDLVPELLSIKKVQAHLILN
jgi:hypothetical protein